MGIEKLKGSLLSEAKNEAKQIVAEARSKADAILKEEKERQGRAKERAEKELSTLLEGQHNERLAWARLEAKRIKAEAEDDVINKGMEEVIASLKELRKTPAYRNFVKRSVLDGCKEAGSRSVIRVVKGERKLVPKVSSARIVEDLDGLGGVVVESNDGKVRMDYSLETLIETKKDDIRKQIRQKLSGGK